jgi:uncharacterized membrane protein
MRGRGRGREWLPEKRRKIQNFLPNSPASCAPLSQQRHGEEKIGTSPARRELQQLSLQFSLFIYVCFVVV